MTIRTANGDALTRLILEIFRINGELLGAGNTLTSPFGLTCARWQMLGAIDEEGRSLTVSQIARRMGLARQGVQRLAKDLEKLGLIRASPNIDHKRAPLFSLSEEGKKTMEKINVVQVNWVNQLAKGLAENQVAEADAILKLVRERSENLN